MSSEMSHESFESWASTSTSAAAVAGDRDEGREKPEGGYDWESAYEHNCRKDGVLPQWMIATMDAQAPCTSRDPGLNWMTADPARPQFSRAGLAGAGVVLPKRKDGDEEPEESVHGEVRVLDKAVYHRANEDDSEGPVRRRRERRQGGHILGKIARMIKLV